MSTVHFYCVLCGSALQTSADSPYDLLKCHTCSRHVPVPRPINGSQNVASYPPVFPPEVLELLVKFQCGSCAAVLYADARCEGREVVCTECGARTAIPRWSHLVREPRFSETGEVVPMRARRPPPHAKAPMLSLEEIDFLRGTKTRKPEATA